MHRYIPWGSVEISVRVQMSNPDGLDNRNWIVGNLVYKFLQRLGQFVMQTKNFIQNIFVIKEKNALKED